ncbi:outer membrane protein [Qipengyuania mesophila]|uniref:Porin family protein n=1 Tax=Qipengyuania mesophila TaxID=2867246 RepID=A0ABS7JQT6_9SPHN|nr:porin family protein [Qipengyuania mesophila]MBX7499997.1 porin family protein [Qipengyuania mesophila]
MRKIALLGAVAAVAAAVPASANEARVEARGGIAWANGVEEAVAGVATGYDFDLGTGAFAGVEASADKILADGADVVFGVTARAGAKIGDAGKLYATAGYSFNDGDAFHAGAGYQHKLGDSTYVKVEYRHFFDEIVDVNTAAIGFGLTF